MFELIFYDVNHQMKNVLLKNIEIISESGCWIWMGACDPKGYGIAHIKGTRKKIDRTHRISYAEFVGEIPDKMHVLHKCDVTSCCNPNHLFIGTNKDNMHDKCIKNRHRNRYTGKILKQQTISRKA